MQPPYKISPVILKLVSAISERIGAIKATHLIKPPTELRKKNRIKTIQSSLEIEGNTLTEKQITAILENKPVIAPAKDILEVQNAITVYEQINSLNPTLTKDFLKAHRILMSGLIVDAGEFRTRNVGVIKGSKVQHLAPPGHMVSSLMKNLFSYLKSSSEIDLIKSCVFHYELEFIHPFSDGNGRMGRLWQTLILLKHSPVFEFLPIETIIKQRQDSYYQALGQSDKMGEATPFIEFMLGVIDRALEEITKSQRSALTNMDRLMIFKELIHMNNFSRQDYLIHFKEISPATASRDLKFGVEKSILLKEGDKRLTTYRFI